MTVLSTQSSFLYAIFSEFLLIFSVAVLVLDFEMLYVLVLKVGTMVLSSLINLLAAIDRSYLPCIFLPHYSLQIFSVNSAINLYQVDQSVFTVCPSVPDIRPSMVFVFEVFLLRGPMVPTDRVVAWGAFPLCDKECRLIFFQYLSRRMSQRS